MLKSFAHSIAAITTCLFILLVFNTSHAQTAKIVVGGNANVKDTAKAALIYSTTDGVKFPDGTVQTTASRLTIGTNTLSIVNNMGGGNYSAAPYSSIVTGHNDSIYPSADFAVIIGGSNNAIRTQALNISGPIPANPNSHNFIGSGEYNTIRANANHSAILGGRNNTIATGAVNSVILGGSNITATLANTVYMQKAALSDLALSGSGYRVLMIDSLGNITASQQKNNNNVLGSGAWMVGGNTNGGMNFLGNNDNYDLGFITNATERIRIMADGSIGIGTIPNFYYNTQTPNPSAPYKLDIAGDTRVLTPGGPIVLKTDFGPSNMLANAVIGVGTESPKRALHVFTQHITVNPPPPPGCPTCLIGPHNGIRLEDMYKINNGPVTNIIWDIAPEYNTQAKMGMLAIGTGDPNNQYNLDGKIVILENGNVGIGTANPSARLDVNTTGGNFKFEGSGSAGYTSTFGMDNTGLKIGHNSTFRDIEFAISNKTIMTILQSGKVGIGVDPSQMTDNHNPNPNIQYKLYVGGGIMTEHCRVALQSSNDWGDWVFDKNNKRMTFNEQIEYYSKNKHLKGIPSSNELKQSGIDVTAMFTAIVINLEEARLDNISLNAVNQDQYKMIEELKLQMKILQEQIDQLNIKRINR